MIRSVIVKLRKDAAVDAALQSALDRCRDLYNAALQERRDAYRHHGASPSFYDQCKSLTEIRAADPVFDALDCTMLRLTALRRVDLAYKAFFRRVKAGETPGYPRFKGRDRFDTLVFGPKGWRLTGGKLRLNGLGPVRVKGNPHRTGVPKGLRLVRKAGRWYAHVLLDIGAAPLVQQSHHGVGIDVGLRTFATMSDGTTVEHPRFLRDSLAELRRAQQALVRKRRGSRRRRIAKAKLARVHHRIANRRHNFVHQTVAELARRYDGFAIEDLDIVELAQQGGTDKAARGLRRGIMDSAWGAFGQALASKAEEAGMPLVRVPPRGTSQRCSGCGSVVRKTLRDRVHDCPACGLVLDRDVNAARNIHDLGWRSAAPSAAEDR